MAFNRQTITHIITASGIALVSALSSPSAAAQTLSPYLRMKARATAVVRHSATDKHKSYRKGTDADRSETGDQNQSHLFMPVIIKVKDNAGMLPDFVNVLNRRGNLFLATVPEDRLGELEGIRFVSRVESHLSSVPQMSEARSFCNLPLIQSNQPGLPALTGQGVVTGFCDTGFWPGHINFLKSDGTSRVKKFVDYRLDSALPTIIETASEMESLGTDSRDETHATHVAGILAGSYSADGYQGIATGADIVATTSPLYDAYLLDGCEQIISYARSQGKPAVINMSISSSTGPHDGTTLFNQYMEKLTDDAVVCIAAANEGNKKEYISREFTSGSAPLRTYPREYPTLSPLVANGIMDIWSSDSRKFSIDLAAWSNVGKKIAYRWECDAALDAGKMVVICSPELADEYPDHAVPLLPERYSGYIYVAAETNPENNRYNVMVYYDVKDITTTDHYAADLMIGPEIHGAEGQRVEIFAGSRIFLSKDYDPEATGGDSTRSINDLCTGEGIVSVGAMTSRRFVPALSGEEIEPVKNMTIGTPAYFSSYGTLDDGRRLPHFCAPGAQVVSSLSGAYLEEHPEVIPSHTCFRREIDGKEYYWGSDQGTSMACPFAAGVIALWLQANPELTPQDARNIAISTASAPALDPGNPRWGGGLLDAKAGLDAAVAAAGGLDKVSADDDATLFVRHLGRGEYAVTCTSGELKTVRVFNLAGAEAVRQEAEGHNCTISLGNLDKSVYIIECETQNGNRLAAKIAF